MKDDPSQATPRATVTLAVARPRSGISDRQWPPPLPVRLAQWAGIYQAIAEGIAADLGGLENMTTGERLLAESAAEADVIRRKLGRRLLTRGLVRKRPPCPTCQGNSPEENPAVKSYFTAQNTVRLHLCALGLRRRAKSIPSLDSYLRSKTSEKAPTLPEEETPRDTPAAPYRRRSDREASEPEPQAGPEPKVEGEP